nr:hypothetical protein [Bifidobacterium aerophilum]
MRIADVQPLVDCSWRSGEPIPPMDGWYVGCAVRPAGGAGFEGPWRAYRYVGAPLTGDNKPKGLTADVLDASADYVFCGVFGLLSEAFAAIDAAGHSDSVNEPYVTMIDSHEGVNQSADDAPQNIEASGSGAVQPADLSRLLVGTTFYGNRPVLSDVNGRPCRLAEYAPSPCGEAVVLGSAHRDGMRDGRVVLVRDLHDESDVRLKDRVAGFLVEASRRHIGGDAEDDLSVVLCRPSVAEQLDLQSDAFAPTLGNDRDPLKDGYVTADNLCGIVVSEPREVLGCYFVWLDEGCAYEAVFGPRPYKRRPERAVVIPDDLWTGAVCWMRDLFGEQQPDFLCLDLVCHRSDADPFVRCSAVDCRSADEILESFRDAGSGGGGRSS